MLLVIGIALLMAVLAAVVYRKFSTGMQADPRIIADEYPDLFPVVDLKPTQTDAFATFPEEEPRPQGQLYVTPPKQPRRARIY